jgi:hypothetical protein
MKLHSMFLREGSVLPSGFDLSQETFIENWMSIRDTTAFALDVTVRAASARSHAIA